MGNVLKWTFEVKVIKFSFISVQTINAENKHDLMHC